MRQLEQVVDDQQVVGLDVQMDLGHAPVGVAEARKVDDQVFVRVFDIAHPNVEESVAFDDRVRLHGQVLRPPRLARNLDAGTAAVVGEAVVAALDGVADDVALRQGQPPVGAAVFQCDRGTVALSVEDDVFVQHRDRQRCGAELVAPCRDVPVISEEHHPLHRVSPSAHVRPVRRAPPYISPAACAAIRSWTIRRACSRPPSCTSRTRSLMFQASVSARSSSIARC